MPVPDQVRDDGSGIQKPLILLDSGFRRNDGDAGELTFYEFINSGCGTIRLEC
jgi:hypothetical protein